MTGLCNALGCSMKMLLELSEKEDEVGKALLRARYRVCDIIEQRGDSMSMLKLKQPIYCGYSDRGSRAGGNEGSPVTFTLEGSISALDAGG